jgi:signal transduction histidine kinase
MRPRRLRNRLTALYAALFLAGGTVLLGLTWVLVARQVPQPGTFQLPVDPRPGQRDEVAYLRTGDGRLVVMDDIPQYIKDAEASVRHAALTSLLTQGAIALGVVATVTAGAGWVVSGRALAPLRRVTDTARRIASHSNLSERIGRVGSGDEVTELASTFDAMLERLDQSFDGQRRFVANASHELRTPLATGRAMVEVAMRRRHASDDLKRLGTALVELHTRQEQLINGLLTLARAEHEITHREPADLAAVVERVISAGARVPIHRDLRPMIVHGDPVLLERLVRNLVRNAVEHNYPGGWVRVVTGPGGLTVTNTGPLVPPDQVEKLFAPFHRIDRAGGPRGSGLGLSIVRSIVRTHGGKITPEARSEGGLIMRVTLP